MFMLDWGLEHISKVGVKYAWVQILPLERAYLWGICGESLVAKSLSGTS